MVNINKIEKYNLQNEVLELKQAGFSLQKIAETLRNSHPDIQELKNLSAMSVQRFLSNWKQHKIQKQLDNGEDPINDLVEEFKNKLYDLDDETHEIYKIMKKALKRTVKEGNNQNIIKAARGALEAIEQTRKNWISLIQWGSNKLKPIEQAREYNTFKIDNFIINLSEELCPKCRRKVVGLVTVKEDET